MPTFYEQMLTLHSSTDPAERITPSHDWTLEDYKQLTAWCQEGYLHLQNETPAHDWGYILNTDYYDSGIGMPWYFEPQYIDAGFMLNTPTDPYCNKPRSTWSAGYAARVNNQTHEHWRPADLS